MYDLRSGEIDRETIKGKEPVAAGPELSEFVIQKCGEAVSLLLNKYNGKLQHPKPFSRLREDLDVDVELAGEWRQVPAELVNSGIVSLKKSRPDIDRPDIVEVNFATVPTWPSRPYIDESLMEQVFDRIKITRAEPAR